MPEAAALSASIGHLFRKEEEVMPNVTQLRQDHANMARLLHVLSHRHKTLVSGERPDFRMMREVVDYILDYMQGFIIPLERQCTQMLCERSEDAAPLCQRLIQQYRTLHERLDKLSDNLDSILMDQIIPMDQFNADLREYVEVHRDYLRAERQELFPLMRDNLSDEEWQQLTDAIPHARTELERLQEAYPELYAELTESDVVTA